MNHDIHPAGVIARRMDKLQNQKDFIAPWQSHEPGEDNQLKIYFNIPISGLPRR